MNQYETLAKKSAAVKENLRRETQTAIKAGAAFVIALAWRDLIQAAIQSVVAFLKNSKLDTIIKNYQFLEPLLNAIIVTIIGVIMILVIS